jgi:hypothetical protein
MNFVQISTFLLRQTEEWQRAVTVHTSPLSEVTTSARRLFTVEACVLHAMPALSEHDEAHARKREHGQGTENISVLVYNVVY